MATHSPRVLIVGAGISGLTLANFLHRAQYPVTVVERSPRVEPAGGGMVLHPNAMRVLALLGLDAAIAARGVTFEHASVQNNKGATLNSVDLRAGHSRDRRTCGVHREDLHTLLLDGLSRPSLKLGCTVTELHTHANGANGVEVALSDGTREHFDLVVGADGVHSATRKALWGDVPLRHAGHTCWRFVITPPASWQAPTTLVEALGTAQRAGLVPLGHNRMYVWLSADAAHDDPRNAAMGRDALLELFQSFEGPVRDAIAEITPDTRIRCDDLYDLWLDHWSHKRVVLLGDAAHAMTPNLAQGGAMAIEDARALHFALDTVPDLDLALARYDALRRPRVLEVHEASWSAGQFRQASNPLVSALRNILVRVMPRSVLTQQDDAFVDGDADLQRMLTHRPTLDVIEPEAAQLVQLLGKVALADGVLGDDERRFILSSLGAARQRVRSSEIEQLITHAARTDIEDLVAPFRSSDPAVREEIVYSAAQLAMVNHAFEPGESTVLEQVRRLLDVPRDTYNQLLQQARHDAQ